MPRPFLFVVTFGAQGGLFQNLICRVGKLPDDAGAVSPRLKSFKNKTDGAQEGMTNRGAEKRGKAAPAPLFVVTSGVQQFGCWA